MKYSLTINNKTTQEIELSRGAILLNNEQPEVDITTIDGSKRHLLHNNKGYTIEIVSKTKEGIELKLNGKKVQIQAKSELDILLDKMGMGAKASNKASDIKAPMPGLIVRVAVEIGQTVQKGDVLLVLEAMKMENAIKATGEGIVSKIAAIAGNKVDKGEILIQFS